MANTAHLLVVDDDREIRDLLSRFLATRGYRVSVARDGAEMMKALENGAIDLIVLDLMLPGEDGLSLCRRVRATSAVPIVMLTAMGEEIDRIVGIEMGADDYLAKPFNPRELLARINAVLRRSGGAVRRAGPGRVRFAGFTLDGAARRLVAADGSDVRLTAGEYDLLTAFVQHPGRVLNRDRLLDLTRGRAAGPFDRSIDIQVSRLRRKIERDPDRPEIIRTVRSGGYVFSPEVEPA